MILFSSILKHRDLAEWIVASKGGTNELGECFLWGEVVKGDAGAVVEFVGNNARVGVVAGDGGPFGQVAAHEVARVLVHLFQGAVGRAWRGPSREHCPVVLRRPRSWAPNRSRPSPPLRYPPSRSRARPPATF